jgi:membrane-associated phospholipid phosphatase
MRGALLLYSAAMALALVYTAEHYVVDILIGWAFVAVTAVLMQRLWPAGSRTARLVAFGRRDSDRGRNGTMGDPEGA